MSKFEYDYHIECPDAKGVRIEGKPVIGHYRKTFHCFLTIREFLDKIAWENSKTFEEYTTATKYLDGCKITIKGAKFTTLFDEENSKKCVQYKPTKSVKYNKAA
jgi:hypothetical protein